MPWSAPKHCPAGHPAYREKRCPVCAAAHKAAADTRRPSARQRGYDGKWDRERKAYLEAHPRCVSCGSPATLVDHIKPHRGDRHLFWSRSNWQPMCASCHGRKTVREDGGFGNQLAARPGGVFEF